MTASDYQIFFPYGATSAPYSAAHPHRGDDYPCLSGTPLVINGVSIGLTGATGNVTGPHLHVQEWHTGYADTRKPQNAFSPGTVTNIDPSGTQGDGSFGKFITIQTADGWSDTYCHLSQINVTVGQEIGGEMPITSFQIDKAVKMSLRRQPTAEELQNQEWAGDPGLMIDTLWNNGGQEQFDNPPDASLRAQVDSLTKANLKLTDQLGALKSQPDPDSVTVTKDGLWASFKRFLGL